MSAGLSALRRAPGRGRPSRAALREEAGRLLGLCACCGGSGLWLGRGGVDACPVCAAAAEAEWRDFQRRVG